MTMLLTFHCTDRLGTRNLLALAVAAGALIGGIVPASACEKTSPLVVANASFPTPTAAVFTGEFVNGVPVYRLPAISVVGQRSAEVAKTQRDGMPARNGRSPAKSAAAPSLPGNGANASRKAGETAPCVG